MELTPKQQALERIKAANKILILTHENPDGDALGSLLALTLALKRIGKTVSAILNEPVPPSYHFLPGINEPQPQPPMQGECVISIDTNQFGDIKLGHKKDPDNRRVFIVMSPERGNIRQEDIHFEPRQYDVDLIISLDCGSVERFGDFYNQHTSLFYETPLINIDHHADNVQFGAVNWVDVMATSTSEVLVSLLEALMRDVSLIDADVATNLLTGIITDTGSFKNANTTPKSLTVAAQLVAAGAKQQDIIYHLFKVKPISTLKLWGTALANLKERPDLKILWTTVSRRDIEDAGAEASEAHNLVDELLKSAQGVAFVFLMTEKNDAIHISFRSVEPGIPVSEVAKLLGGGGHDVAAGAEIDDTLSAAEEKVLQAVSDFWASRGIQPR